MLLHSSGTDCQRIQALRVNELGQRVQRFRKAIISTGRFIKEADDMEFEVTPETLSHWVTTFKAMKKNGVKVPIPNMHSGDGDPEQNHGWVEDMFVDGDSLVMTCDIIGDSSIDAASKSDVSISSPGEMTDGKGNKYVRPIVHVAMCTNPVIPGLGDFVPIAASRSKESIMDWKKIKEGLGIEDELTDETAPAIVLSKFSALVSKIKAMEDKDKEKGESKGGDKDPELSKPDPMLIKLAADNRGMKIDSLVAAGRITPDVASKFKKMYVDIEPLTLALSNGTADQFDELVNALVENDPVKLKEVTAAQVTVQLSDPMRKTDNNPLIADAEARAKEARELAPV